MNVSYYHDCSHRGTLRVGKYCFITSAIKHMNIYCSTGLDSGLSRNDDINLYNCQRNNRNEANIQEVTDGSVT